MNVLRDISQKAKDHPVIAWGLSILPFIGVTWAIAGAWNRATIDAYRAKADTLFQQVAQLEAHANQTQAAVSMETPSLARQTHVSPSINPEKLHLRKATPAFAANGRVKFILDSAFEVLGNAMIIVYIDDHRERVDLYIDGRKSVAVGPQTLFLDLVSVTYESADLVVTPAN